MVDLAGRPARILHIVDGGERRGAEVFLSDLAGALERHGIEQRVAVLMGVPPFAVDYGVEVTALQVREGGVPGLHVDRRAVSRLRQMVGTWAPTIVQTHGGSTLKYGALATRTSPIVARVIGMAPAWVGHGPRRVLHARLLRRARRVAAVADAVRDELVGTFGLRPERVRTVPNGIDVRRLSPARDRSAMRTELGVEPDAPVMISVGALSWEKDPIAQLAIAERVRSRHPGLVHLVVGDGPLREDVRARIAERDLGRTVRLLGSRPDVGDLLAAADVLLLASRADGMEGMPAVVIEAGLAQLPVAAYGVAGVAEVVLDDVTGSLAPAGELDRLTDQVDRLLRSPERRATMGVAARERCLARFDIDVVAGGYLDLYRSLAVRSTGGVPR